MRVKKWFMACAFGLLAQEAGASSDFVCEPNWTLDQIAYSRCSNLPLLSPGNDTRVNLKLLFVDAGLAALQVKPVSKDDAESGYGKVPFSLETFEKSIFKAHNAADSANGDEQTGEFPGYVTGSRCDSNFYGKAGFIDALEQSKELPPGERQLLSDARNKLNPDCVDRPASTKAGSAGVSDLVDTIASPTGRQFMAYLSAATAFYEGRYMDAVSNFTLLSRCGQPWLEESSRYMLGRAELNRAQQNAFDEYGFPDLKNVEQKPLQSAESHFKSYLKDYPDGLYAASARGLLRRVYWLSNQQQKLADEYDRQLNRLSSVQQPLSLDELALEVDTKLLATADPTQIQSPLLLAVLDLSLMRGGSSEKKQLGFADLQKQQPVFAGHKELYQYLLAAHRYYVQNDAAGALKVLPATAPPKMTYLDFSRLMLRGLALEALKDRSGARTVWRSLFSAAVLPLQNETVQLALALNYEQSRQLEPVFEPDSPITDPAIRTILLRRGASAGLLRKRISSNKVSPLERSVAIYTLLYKDLFQGQYRDYIRDYTALAADVAKAAIADPSCKGDCDKPKLALFSWSGKESDDSYRCPSTLDIARRLAKNAKDPVGLLCLGDMINANNLDPGTHLDRYRTAHPSAAKIPALGSAPSHFPGTEFLRDEGYRIIIAHAQASPDQKAYALYRAIKCYATSGINHCGGKEVEKSVRKSWFQTLKKRYANSKWAQSLKYYW